MPTRKHWESDFMALEIYEVSGEELSSGWSPAPADRCDVWETTCAADDAAGLDRSFRAGFALVETAVDFVLPVPAEPAAPDLRQATEPDLPGLRAITDQSFQESRFRRSPFGPAIARKFYGHWVKQAVAGLFDDGCWVVDDSDGVCGFVSLRRLDDGAARIGLIAVREGMRGQGTGTRLLAGAMGVVRRWGCDRIMVATQLSNLPAVRFYERQGGRMRSALHRLYRLDA